GCTWNPDLIAVPVDALTYPICLARPSGASSWDRRDRHGYRLGGGTAARKVLVREKEMVGDIVLARATQVLAWSRGTSRTCLCAWRKVSLQSGSLAWSRRPFLPMPSCWRSPAKWPTRCCAAA